MQSVSGTQLVRDIWPGMNGPYPNTSLPKDFVALGNTLYHSELLSAKGNLSCASCHDLATYGVDQ